MPHIEPGQPLSDPAAAEETEFHLPEEHWPLPELSHVPTDAKKEPTQDEFLAVSQRPEYAKLRSTFRGFAFPMCIAGLAAYFVYVVLSIFLPDFMGLPLFGSLSVGMTIGLAQFAITWIWTAIYVNFANKRLDPIANSLKSELEGI